MQRCKLKFTFVDFFTAVSPIPQNVDSARSVATGSDVLNSARSESNQSRQNGSITEDLPTERSSSTRNRKSSVTEEISTARSHTAEQPSSEEVADDVSEVGKASRFCHSLMHDIDALEIF